MTNDKADFTQGSILKKLVAFMMPVLGALILGVSEAFISAYVSTAMRDLFAYILLILILLVRPSGLMGKSSEDKA